MAEAIATTLAKYSTLTILSFFVPAFVYGAVFSAIVPHGYLDGLVYAMAAIAIVVHFARESVIQGVASALGIGAGSLVSIAGFKDIFLTYVGKTIGALLLSMWGYFVQVFTMAVMLGIVVAFTAIGALLVAIPVGLFISASVRVVNFIQDIMEGLSASLLKNIENVGIKALVAPAIAAIMMGVVYGSALVWLIMIFIFAAGFVLGLAITLWFSYSYTIVSVFLALFGFMLDNLLIRYTAPNRDVLLDVFTTLIFPWLAPLLWWAGYAMLLSRRTAHHGLYYIALALTVFATQ